jgi:hypothetical protein
MPFAASQDFVFSVSYGEVRRSEMIFQKRECAQYSRRWQTSNRAGISQYFGSVQKLVRKA